MELTHSEVYENYIKPFSNGSCMHYSMLQPEMEYFQHEFGLISYIKKYGFHFVLSEPIFKSSEKQHKTKLIQDFLNYYNKVSFVQVSKEFSELLHTEFNYYSTQIGDEKLINIQNWNTTGKRKQVIRTACNQARKQGIKIIENPYEDRFSSISSEWLRTRKVKEREIRFLVRKHPYFEKDTRVLCAYDSDRSLIAYIIFSPILENGKCVGYVPDISRSSPVFKQGIYYALMVEAIKIFKAEGKQYINLGLSPLILDNDAFPYESWKLRFVFKIIKRYGASLYNYNGINYTKSRFLASNNSNDGFTEKVYYSHKSSFPLFEIIAIFRASNII